MEITIPTPDGPHVKARRRYPVEMLYDGDIPDLLTPHVEQMIAETMVILNIPSSDDRKRTEELRSDENRQRANDFYRWAICAHAIEPRLTDSFDEYRKLRDEGVAVEHLSQRSGRDLTLIFHMVLGVTVDLAVMFPESGRAT